MIHGGWMVCPEAAQMAQVNGGGGSVHRASWAGV
ncbi:hypothetical protein L915_10751 [Phytophthora nicotianae]|uniref:Uncharacterized protein n=1 Tax=Phytophthora nicotianae TaxID=4792 RepID=W2IUB2_PHYNI|nr:hypothetical protein L915_10751 [Phytophthora nicotianae]ETL37711.1 hypothetical protein L916_10644 [Phytophthora nicotianae]